MTHMVIVEGFGGFYFTVPAPSVAADYIKESRKMWAALESRGAVATSDWPRAWLMEVRAGHGGVPQFTVVAEVTYDAATDGPLLEPVT